MKEYNLTFIVDKDLVLSEFLKTKLSKKFYKRLKFLNAKIFVNGESYLRYLPVKINDVVSIYYEEEIKNDWPIYDKPLNIYYEDDNYLVVYKEANLLSIPTKSEQKSLYQQISAYLNFNSHISLLNRLDKETQGLVLVAKNTYSASLLAPVKENIKRKYLALVKGNMDGRGTINLAIKRSLDSNKRVISEDGKKAITHYQVLKNYEDATLVELELETGRTHQIRLHLATLGHPIVGDPLYGISGDIMCLESYYLAFIDPFTKEKKEFYSRGAIWQKKK